MSAGTDHTLLSGKENQGNQLLAALAAAPQYGQGAGHSAAAFSIGLRSCTLISSNILAQFIQALQQ